MDNFQEFFPLEIGIGLIQEEDQLCPGVYLLTAQNDDELLPRDYYAVMEKSIIPQEAKSYGQKVSNLWLFPLTDGNEEYKIINYEVARYRAKNKVLFDTFSFKKKYRMEGYRMPDEYKITGPSQEKLKKMKHLKGCAPLTHNIPGTPTVRNWEITKKCGNNFHRRSSMGFGK